MSDPNLPPPPGGGFSPPPPPGGGAPPPPQPPQQPPPPGGGGYGGPPGGFNPPPAQPYGGGNVPPLDAGASISYGWKKFQEDMGTWAGLAAVPMVAIPLLALLGFLVFLPAATGTDTGFIISWILGILVFLVIFAVSFAVQAGLFRAALATTRGERPSFQMLTDTTNLGPFILTVLLVGIGTSIGLILCILPGIAFLILTAYAPLLVLDKGMSPIDAISRSIELVRSNLGPVALVLVLAYLVYAIPASFCFLLGLASMPVGLIALTYSYRALHNEPVAP